MVELRRPTETDTSWRADETDETRCAGSEDNLEAVVVGCPTARGRGGSSGENENDTGYVGSSSSTGEVS